MKIINNNVTDELIVVVSVITVVAWALIRIGRGCRIILRNSKNPRARDLAALRKRYGITNNTSVTDELIVVVLVIAVDWALIKLLS
jgi:hypothetical protein